MYLYMHIPYWVRGSPTKRHFARVVGSFDRELDVSSPFHFRVLATIRIVIRGFTVDGQALVCALGPG